MIGVNGTDLNANLFATPQLKRSPNSVCETIALTSRDQLLPAKCKPPLRVPAIRRGIPPIMEDEPKSVNISPTLLPKCCPVRAGVPTVRAGVPKLPPKSPICGRPRSVSESDASSTQRRSIFGQYWNQCGSGSSIGGRSPSLASVQDCTPGASIRFPTFTPTPPQRNRASSLDVINVELPPLLKDYRMYAPPKDHAERSPICGRFASVQEVPMNLMLESLPPLPSPLQRLCFYRNLQGMYPMTTPVPILRQRSNRSLQDDPQQESGRSESQSVPLGKGPPAFNLTKSWRSDGRDISFGECSVSTSSTESSGPGLNKGGVRFDPRVTVTEFEDNIERCWYNDEELDRLRHETILVVQEYFLTHPDQALQYNKDTLDQVTGTYRKKALFSLPALSTTDDEIFKPTQQECAKLIKTHIQTILIVDPNKAILDLFSKSMSTMFPTAQIYKTRSGEEALTWTTAPHRRIDIIIVEERLALPLATTPSLDMGQGLSLNGESGRRFLALHKSMSECGGIHTTRYSALDVLNSNSSSSSNSGLSSRPLSGSHLLQILQSREDEMSTKHDNDINKNAKIDASCSKGVETAPVCTRPVPRKALLIGVSMHPDRDAIAFRNAGADLVWGKPIPRVGEPLRNHILHCLVNKRRDSLVQVAPSEDGGVDSC